MASMSKNDLIFVGGVERFNPPFFKSLRKLFCNFSTVLLNRVSEQWAHLDRLDIATRIFDFGPQIDKLFRSKRVFMPICPL
ncbi:hypothetical protein POHY109586_23370 [Polaromonas hydrogenivorans]